MGLKDKIQKQLDYLTNECDCDCCLETREALAIILSEDDSPTPHAIAGFMGGKEVDILLKAKDSKKYVKIATLAGTPGKIYFIPEDK